MLYIDSHIVSSHSRKLNIRCETNIYTLYRGAAEAELQVMDEHFWIQGGKVSPTTDQRGGGNRGDPDNSALTGSAIVVFAGAKCLVFRLALLWLLLLLIS